jgi:phosphoglycerate dehydrogenase-like enzyme
MTVTVLAADDPDAPSDAVGSLEGIQLLTYSSPDELPDGADKATVLIANGNVDTVVEVMRRLPRLKLLQTLSAGVEQWEGKVPEGVSLSNARGAHGGATAEWAVAALLAVLRELPAFTLRQGDGHWDQHTTDTLDGKAVLVLGAGDLAAEFRRRAEPFGATVEVVGRAAREGVHGMDELDDLLPRFDVVVAMLPLTGATRGLVDARMLGLLKDDAVFINAGRGPSVVTDDLIAALQGGRLRAALDVTDPEPLPDGHPLWSAPNVLITPHVAGSTRGFQQRAWTVAAKQIAQFSRGEEPANLQS